MFCQECKTNFWTQRLISIGQMSDLLPMKALSRLVHRCYEIFKLEDCDADVVAIESSLETTKCAVPTGAELNLVGLCIFPQKSCAAKEDCFPPFTSTEYHHDTHKTHQKTWSCSSGRAQGHASDSVQSLCQIRKACQRKIREGARRIDCPGRHLPNGQPAWQSPSNGAKAFLCAGTIGRYQGRFDAWER
jgi:hypothetical protein